MPYLHAQIEAGNTIEHKKYYSGRYKAKIKNSPPDPDKETPQNQKDYQDRKSEKDVRRLIDENFWFGDYWTTLCYPAWSKPTTKQVKKDIDKFLDTLRRRYKKKGEVLKYIYTAGRGKRGAVHFHLVINEGLSISEISEVWWNIVGTEKEPCPRVHFRTLDRSGYYGRVAAYLIKNSKETFWSEERIFGRRYCASTNLNRPKFEKTIVPAKTWRDEPKAPKGYYLLKDSLYTGFDKETGYPYQEYIFVRINSVDIRNKAGTHKNLRKRARGEVPLKHSRLKSESSKRRRIRSEV